MIDKTYSKLLSIAKKNKRFIDSIESEEYLWTYNFLWYGKYEQVNWARSSIYLNKIWKEQTAGKKEKWDKATYIYKYKYICSY